MPSPPLHQRLLGLPRRAKQAVLAVVDATVVILALGLACLYMGHTPGRLITEGYLQFVLAAVGAVLALAAGGLYREVLRYAGARLPLAVATCLLPVAAAMVLARDLTLLAPLYVPRPVVLAFWALASLGLVALRLAARAWLVGRDAGREPVVIYGAGTAGAKLVAALAMGQQYRPVALVDDDPRLAGTVIAGVRIRSPAELPVLVARHRVGRVLLALPAIDRRQRRAIIEGLARLAVHVQTVPDIADLVTGRARVDDLHEVDVVDLLGREPVPPDPALLDRCIRGKSVMVTGAGGSIGSALCQQILLLGPRRLVLFEISEHALYRVEQDLRRTASRLAPEVEIVALLGSVHHLDRVHSIMTAFGVQTVYHAAAYKHVPIVEANMVEGIHNNIIGTWHTAEAAEAAGVETFVLVSTDKAVNPTNVMGATKRVAELVLQGMAERGARTRFCMVRFGNVLDSSGSVVPLFREQIRGGGPVTVTHPEVVRYFMTIPEAAALVIQAGSMASGGDVFLLDMGEPVRIADLARRMINLAGCTVRDADHPDGSIPILYTGLRPGEKLYEELLIGGDTAATGHPRIQRAVEAGLPWARVRYLLGEFLAAANTFDCERALALLHEANTGYQPTATSRVEDLVWRESAGGSRLPDRTPLEASLRLIAARPA